MKKDEKIIFCPFADDGRIVREPKPSLDLKTKTTKKGTLRPKSEG